MGQDEDRALDPATGYVSMFNAFFARADMNAPYKAVFLKCLLDLGKYNVHGHNNRLPGSEWIAVDGDVVTLDLNFIAARFLKYSWDMDDSFQFKQTKNSGEAKIVQLVRKGRKISKSSNPPTLEELAYGFQKLRQETITSVITKQAMKYLPRNMPSLYVRVTRSNKIRLNTDMIQFFRQHRSTIQKGLNRKIAGHIEMLNKEIPHVATKLGEEDASCALYPGAGHFMDSEQQQRCFYCDDPYGRGQSPYIDHVIPITYAFFAGMHNRVVACATCSLKKRDRPPAAALFLDVLDRNDGLKRRLSRFPFSVRRSLAGYDGVWYRKTYTSCLAEHRGDERFFRP